MAKGGLRTAILALLLGFLGLPAFRACYSGLVLIPTTDVTGHWMWAVDLQWQGTSHLFETGAFVVNTEVGIGDRFEAGLDFDLSEGASETVYFNAKYVLLKGTDGRFSAAVGIQNTTKDARSSPYAVATLDLGPFRSHVGMQRTPGADRTDPFFGIDRTFGDRWQLMADYTAGLGNFASAGVGYMRGNWQVVVGSQWPNGGGRPVVVVHVIFMGSLGRRRG